MLKTLILMRHAKAESWTEGVDDFGRALTPRGHADAERMSEALAGLGLLPDLILVSAARRTRETAAHAGAVFKGERIRPMEVLYLAGVVELAAAVEAARTSPTVMIIGHNPGLHDYALALADGGTIADDTDYARLVEKLPTSGAVVFSVPEDAPKATRRLRLERVLRVSDFTT